MPVPNILLKGYLGVECVLFKLTGEQSVNFDGLDHELLKRDYKGRSMAKDAFCIEHFLPT